MKGETNMNLARRIAQAMELIHQHRLQDTSKNPLVQEVASTEYGIMPGYYTYYAMGKRSMEIEVEKSGPNPGVVMVKLSNEEEDSHIIVFDYDTERGSNSNWLHEGAWCTMVDDMISVAENHLKEELQRYEHAFRLPSILS